MGSKTDHQEMVANATREWIIPALVRRFLTEQSSSGQNLSAGNDRVVILDPKLGDGLRFVREVYPARKSRS